MSKQEKQYSVTTFALTITLVVMLLIGIPYVLLTMSDENNPPWLAIFTTVIVTELLIFGILFKFLELLDQFHKKQKVSAREKCKRDLMIGFGLITVLGAVPVLVGCFVEYNLFTVHCLIIIYPITSFLLMSHFFPNFEKKCTYNTDKNGSLIFAMIFTGIFLLILSLRTQPFYLIYDKETGHVLGVFVLFYLGFSTLFGISLGDFMMVLTDGIVYFGIKESEGTERKITKMVRDILTEQKEEKFEENPGPECGICLLAFSEKSRTPRILKECGHTVCEECADVLLEKHNKQHLFCPFCQGITVVNGWAYNLPKNNALLEYMRDLQNSLC